MPVRDWRDGTNDVVPMRDYSNVFTPSTKVYVECKLQLYNIVEGPGKRAIVRPLRVASAIIDHIRVLPDDEAGIRLMYIDSVKDPLVDAAGKANEVDLNRSLLENSVADVCVDMDSSAQLQRFTFNICQTSIGNF
ncbi:hypothetical protein F5878DRAFT_643466 [Lentinula raphanica]|uniref:Uncharacterized protein n=1 Tax=Lentinula raphanica TaxID=153919 RepID=A0AA38P5Q3_9AGAR|nr:hypothetical protein F5878DRAFT_643466 [Lentinula raphanica]